MLGGQAPSGPAAEAYVLPKRQAGFFGEGRKGREEGEGGKGWTGKGKGRGLQPEVCRRAAMLQSRALRGEYRLG